MSVVELKTHVSFEQLLDAVSRLTPEDLDRFIEHINSLRSKRSSQASESRLLALVQQPVDPRSNERYLQKHQSENLSEDGEEYQELLSLTAQREQHHARRLEALVQLADKRDTSLDEVMGLLPAHD